MKKHLFGLLLAVFLAVGLLPTVAAAETVSNVQYRNYDAENGTWIDTATCPSATVVTNQDTTWTGGWYVVNSDVTIGTPESPQPVTVSGDVHLILMNDRTLTVNGGIVVRDDDDNVDNGSPNSITIYAQSTNEATMGKLITMGATGQNAGIGGGGNNKSLCNCGTITINGGYIQSNGANIGAGIGGAVWGHGGTVTINGGTIVADGRAGAGIGGGSGGSGGIITIHGGAVKATSTGDGAGIGGGTGGSGGIITIHGGVVKATSTGDGADIGGGFDPENGGAGGNVTIEGGTVTAGKFGGGNTDATHGGRPGAAGTFSTGTNGNAVIFANEICDQSKKNNWSGVIFEGNDGQVYGTSVTPVENFTIGSGKTLLIPESASLTIMGITAVNSGSVYVDGALTGTVSGDGPVYYHLTVNGCNASTTYTYGNKTYGKPGETVTLTTNATPVEGEELIWTVTPEMDISSGSFNMPANAVTITAAITPKTYQVSYNTNGGTFVSTPADTYTFRTGATLPTNIKKAGYTFKGWYDNSAFNGNPFTAIGTTETGDKSFWAKWEANTYTVAFDTDGGSDIADKSMQWEDTVLTGVATPAKTGWEFLGWKYNDTPVNASTKYSGLGVADTVQDVQLKAQWKDVAAPVISGVVNGKTYCLTRTVTVSDNVGVTSVTVDGVTVTLENNQFVLSPKETPQVIIAKDAAGNTSAEMIVTVNSEHKGGTATCTMKATCIHCGTKYGLLDGNKHNLEYIPAKGATVTETGNKEYWHCKDCGKYFSDSNGTNSVALSDTVISKLPPSIINGGGQSLTAGEWKELTFRSNAAFADFVRVELDGHTVERSRYTVKEGSTIVSLKADYVRTLSAGEHTLGIVSTNGTATTTFTVHAPTASDNSQASPEGNVSASVNTPSANKNPLSVPPTGDDSPLGLWVVALVVSGVLLIILGVVLKKRRSKK